MFRNTKMIIAEAFSACALFLNWRVLFFSPHYPHPLPFKSSTSRLWTHLHLWQLEFKVGVMSCMWATVCVCVCVWSKNKRESRLGQVIWRKEMWESAVQNAEDCSYITRVKSLWLHPDQSWLPALKRTSCIKGQLWRNLNTTGTGGYFSRKLKTDSWEDCLIFEVQTNVFIRVN